VTNHLADELRGILAELDNDPMSGHIEPITRERLVMLIAHVERLHAEPEPTVEITAAGLDPEQEIRARALDAAAGVAYYPLESGSAAAVVNQVLDVAELLTAWIRHGARP
jgi:hypothetical protein